MQRGWCSWKWGVGLLLPQGILILLFYIWPMLRVCRQAFYYIDPFGIQASFSGIRNLVEVLNEPSYWHAVGTTLLLMGWIVGLTTTLGLMIALTLHHVQKGRTLYKLLLWWPYAVAPAIAAVLWRFLFHPTLGWVSQLLAVFHVSFNYLIHVKQALGLIVLIAVWQQLSYNILFFFVSLESIPKSVMEAALLDGVSAWRRFWRIVFPMLRPTVIFLVLMNALYAFFETFSVIDLLTAGGPGDRTTTLLYKIYKDGFLGMDWSSAAVQSLLLMVLVVVMTVVRFQYDTRQVPNEK